MNLSTHSLSSSVRSAALTAVCCSTMLGAVQSARAGGGPTVSQKGTTLFVDGSRADDRLVIHRSGAKWAYGELEVWDVSSSPGVVLGIYSGVEDIDVDLPDGNNFLGLYGFWLSGDAVITTGDGNNQVNVGGVGEGRLDLGGLSVTTGAGFDIVRLAGCDILTAEINTGDAGDFVLTGHQLGPSADFHVWAHGISVNTGDGLDYVSMINSEIFTASVDTGAEDDWTLIGIGYDKDAWSIGGNEFSDLSLATDAGSDFAALLGNEIYGDVVIETGQQSDDVLLGGFGAPNDFQGAVTADGGGGNDELYDDLANLYAAPPTFVNFETIFP